MKNKLHVTIAAILLTLILNKVNAQNYKDQFKNDICNCFENKINELRNSRSAYEQCFNKALPNHASAIDASINEENQQLKYKKGQELRKELKFKFFYELVSSCDMYYQILEEERQRKLMSAKSRVSRSHLERINQQVAMTPNSTSYYRRAETYFYLGELKLAEADIRESLKLHKTGYNAAYLKKEQTLLGWILEEQKRYPEAIEIYNNVYNNGYSYGYYYYQDTKILAALVKRKAGIKGNTTSQPTVDNAANANNQKQIPAVNTSGSQPKKPTTAKPKKDLKKLFKL